MIMYVSKHVHVLTACCLSDCYILQEITINWYQLLFLRVLEHVQMISNVQICFCDCIQLDFNLSFVYICFLHAAAGRSDHFYMLLYVLYHMWVFALVRYGLVVFCLTVPSQLEFVRSYWKHRATLKKKCFSGKNHLKLNVNSESQLGTHGLWMWWLAYCMNSTKWCNLLRLLLRNSRCSGINVGDDLVRSQFSIRIMVLIFSQKPSTSGWNIAEN